MTHSKLQLTEEITQVLNRPSISPDDLLKTGALPVSRQSLYEAIARGDIESFRIGRRILIPTAPLRRRLGMVG